MCLAPSELSSCTGTLLRKPGVDNSVCVFFFNNGLNEEEGGRCIHVLVCTVDHCVSMASSGGGWKMMQSNMSPLDAVLQNLC